MHHLHEVTKISTLWCPFPQADQWQFSPRLWLVLQVFVLDTKSIQKTTLTTSLSSSHILQASVRFLVVLRSCYNTLTEITLSIIPRLWLSLSLSANNTIRQQLTSCYPQHTIMGFPYYTQLNAVVDQVGPLVKTIQIVALILAAIQILIVILLVSIFFLLLGILITLTPELDDMRKKTVLPLLKVTSTIFLKPVQWLLNAAQSSKSRKVEKQGWCQEYVYRDHNWSSLPPMSFEAGDLISRSSRQRPDTINDKLDPNSSFQYAIDNTGFQSNDSAGCDPLSTHSVSHHQSSPSPKVISQNFSTSHHLAHLSRQS